MASARVPQTRPGGRHLLRSRQLAEAIVRDAGVEPGDLVVDVGAGSGMLTSALSRAGARVIAIEPDRRLADRLRRACREVRVVEAEALATAWPTEPFRVVANLPFAAAADICRSLLSRPSIPLVSLDAVVEWDFAAKRARLWPSTALSVLWGAWWELSVVRRLPPSDFVPPPSVAAGILRARRRREPLVEVGDAGRYEGFVRGGFRRRRDARELDAHAWAALFAAGPARRKPSASARTVPPMTRGRRTR